MSTTPRNSKDPEPAPDGAACVNWSALYRDFPGLRALILRRVGNPELAADILQDAAVTTLEKLKNGEIAHPEKLAGYLFRVALNHLRNYRRKERARTSCTNETDDLLSSEEALWHGIDREGWAQAVRQLLEELPVQRDRDVLIRFYLHDEERPDICRDLRLSAAHFHRVIFRARDRFRQLLAQRGFAKGDFLTLIVVTVWLCAAGTATPGRYAPGSQSLTRAAATQSGVA